MAENNQANKKKILNKFEWFLLVFALGILTIVLLQNMGVNMIETTEKVEISEAERKARDAKQTSPEVNTLYEKKNEIRNN